MYRIALLALLTGLSLYLLITVPTKAQNQASFTFTAVGDYGNETTSPTVLQGIGKEGANFHIVLGDFSYDEVTPESSWCQMVKDNLNTGAGKSVGDAYGETFPFELLSGDHESNGIDGFIENFSACLPDRLGTIQGTYGKEYFFDYPQVSPIARFILISPNITFVEGVYSYTVGSPRYDWLAATIDGARAAGIKWVIVGMHFNNISTGYKDAQVVSDTMNLLLNKKVDLILQANEHNYQRSKQLALGPNCATLGRENFDADCIVDDGADDLYSRGKGTVIVIDGTGGKGLYDIDLSSVEKPYFAKYMGNNVSGRHGFMKYSVSWDSINAQFVPTEDTSTFSDAFTIIDESASPTPSSIPTPSLSPTPTPNNLTILPSADATVKKARPKTNYGSVSELHVDNDPVEQTYMKFNLSALAGKRILSAKLRIMVANASSETQDIKLTSQNTWTENTITYNNRPGLGTAIGNIKNTSAGQWKEIDITPTVSAKAGGVLSFGITMSGMDGFWIDSKEAASGKPHISVSYY